MTRCHACRRHWRRLSWELLVMTHHLCWCAVNKNMWFLQQNFSSPSPERSWDFYVVVNLLLLRCSRVKDKLRRKSGPNSSDILRRSCLAFWVKLVYRHFKAIPLGKIVLVRIWPTSQTSGPHPVCLLLFPGSGPHVSHRNTTCTLKVTQISFMLFGLYSPFTTVATLGLHLPRELTFCQERPTCGVGIYLSHILYFTSGQLKAHIHFVRATRSPEVLHHCLKWPTSVCCVYSISFQKLPPRLLSLWETDRNKSWQGDIGTFQICASCSTGPAVVNPVKPTELYHSSSSAFWGFSTGRCSVLQTIRRLYIPFLKDPVCKI